MKKGFTLLETLIVIIIIGILVGLALPLYTKAKERALGNEAKANLKLIAAAERIYKMEIGGYYTSSNITNINSNLRLMLNTNNWAYNITGGATNFTTNAYRQGSGGYLDCQYSLAHNDADGEPNPSASCP